MATATAPRAKTVQPPKVEDQSMLIGGKWVDSASGKTFPTLNPATGETICQVAEGDKADARADEVSGELLHSRVTSVAQ